VLCEPELWLVPDELCACVEPVAAPDWRVVTLLVDPPELEPLPLVVPDELVPEATVLALLFESAGS
jgi:hypothetical protein